MSQREDDFPISPEALAALSPEVQAIIAALVMFYEAKIARLETRIAELEGRTPKTPRNSSLPPSSEHLHAKPQPEKPKSSRKPGGQAGHEKHARALIPTAQCTAVEVLKPCTCRRCDRRLAGSDAAPLRHQVWELPEIKPQVTEYQLHRLTCLRCGESTCAELPPGVPTGQSGPRLIAFTAMLMGHFRQSKRRAALFLETILGQPCSAGLVVKLQNISTEALRPSYDELQQALSAEPCVNADESPTKQGPHKAWLWTVVAPLYTVFALRTSRKAEVIKGLLGESYRGVVTCDRAKMYLWLGSIQWCWAHLRRDFQAMYEAGGKATKLGAQLVDLTNELFHHWHRARDGTLSRRGLTRHLNRLSGTLYLVLEEGLECGHAPTAATCRELLACYDSLWTFASTNRVEPTNNAAERALRHGVIWRKLSFGTQSAAGSRFVETLLTVVETCRQQERSAFGFITEAVEAYISHRPGPSLRTSV